MDEVLLQVVVQHFLLLLVVHLHAQLLKLLGARLAHLVQARDFWVTSLVVKVHGNLNSPVSF